MRKLLSDATWAERYSSLLSRAIWTTIPMARTASTPRATWAMRAGPHRGPVRDIRHRVRRNGSRCRRRCRHAPLSGGRPGGRHRDQEELPVERGLDQDHQAGFLAWRAGRIFRR